MFINDYSNDAKIKINSFNKYPTECAEKEKMLKNCHRKAQVVIVGGIETKEQQDICD
jgi:hypothetical protein